MFRHTASTTADAQAQPTEPTRAPVIQPFKSPLPPAIDAALRDSARLHGILVPVVKDQHGRILDGHNRARIADELGLDYPVEVIRVIDDAHAAEIARTLNADRRQLSGEDRRRVALELRMAGHSIRAISEVTDVAPATVLRDLSSGGPHETPAQKVRGRDGKTYPAKKPPPEATDRQAADRNAMRLRDSLDAALNLIRTVAADTIGPAVRARLIQRAQQADDALQTLLDDLRRAAGAKP